MSLANSASQKPLAPSPQRIADLDLHHAKTLGIGREWSGKYQLRRYHQPPATAWLGDITEEEGSPAKPPAPSAPPTSATNAVHHPTRRLGHQRQLHRPREQSHVLATEIISYLANCVSSGDDGPPRQSSAPDLPRPNPRPSNNNASAISANGSRKLAMPSTTPPPAPCNPSTTNSGFTHKNNTLFIHLLNGYKPTGLDTSPTLTTSTPNPFPDLYTKTPLPHDDAPHSPSRSTTSTAPPPRRHDYRRRIRPPHQLHLALPPDIPLNPGGNPRLRRSNKRGRIIHAKRSPA